MVTLQETSGIKDFRKAVMPLKLWMLPCCQQEPANTSERHVKEQEEKREIDRDRQRQGHEWTSSVLVSFTRTTKVSSEIFSEIVLILCPVGQNWVIWPALTSKSAGKEGTAWWWMVLSQSWIYVHWDWTRYRVREKVMGLVLNGLPWPVSWIRHKLL